MGTIAPLTSRPSFSAPAPLTPDHQFQNFDCGKLPLNDWLKNRALRSESRSARTYVSCFEENVVGYYCFSNGTVRREELPTAALRKDMPSVVPMTLMGRLAIDKNYHGMGIGRGLLKDGFTRALAASRIVASRAVLVHAIDEEAAAFYASYGFQPFPEGKLTFFLPMESIESAIR